MSLGIYIQVPFCQTKCTYCNFHTGVVSRDRYQPYADAICCEIAESTPVDDRDVDTVYFGGGTPSLLDPAALAKILAALHENFPFASSVAEVTLEADPETIPGALRLSPDEIEKNEEDFPRDRQIILYCT